MTSPVQEAASRLPTVHEYGQRATLGPAAAEASAVASSPQPAPVSPLTVEATPSARYAEPASLEQQHGPPVKPNVQQDAVAAPAAAGEPANEVYAAEKASPIYAWQRRHMLLIVLALILSIVGLGLSGHAAATGAFDLSGEDSILAIPVPVYVLTIVFAVAETSLRVALKFKRGFHPAVHIGVWLICWIIYAGLIAAFAILVRWAGERDDDDGYAFYKRQFIVQFVFIVLLFLNTFVLFISACIDAQAYNVAKATPPSTDAAGNPLDPNHHEDRAWRVTKLVFNILVIVFGIIGFAIGLSMVRFRDTYSASNIVFPACACALLIPLVWAVADLCFSLTGPRRRFFQGMHPGAHVGMWLVSWIILAIVGGMLTTFAVINVAQCQDYRDRNMRRAVAVDGYALRHVPVVNAAVSPNHVRQISGTTSTHMLATSTANTNGNINTMGSTSTGILGSLPTTTTSPYSSDPYDPYDPYNPYGDDPNDDPYEDPYYPYRPSSSSSSYSSRPTQGSYGSNPSDDDPYSSDPSNYPHNSNYYNNPYDQAMDDFCSQKGVDGPMIATCVFMWIVFVFAFVLFVAGCSDTYLRNHLRNHLTVVYVPVGQPVQYQYPQQPLYSNMPMQGSEKQLMPQAPVMQQQQQQQQQPGQASVVEYYGSAQ